MRRDGGAVGHRELADDRPGADGRWKGPLGAGRVAGAELLTVGLKEIVRATSKDGVPSTDLNLLVRLQVSNQHAKLSLGAKLIGDRALTERNEKLTEDVDDLLDEIDDVLEENAEEFVKQYVQKGGE